MRVLLPLLVAVSFLALAPAADAQTPCSYDECALRIEPDASGIGVRLARGAEGTPVGRIAPFRSDLQDLVAASPAAAALARTAGRSRTRAFVSGLAAGALLFLATDGAPLDGASAVVRAGVGLAGGGAALYGVREALRGQRLAAESVWEYNRGLDR